MKERKLSYNRWTGPSVGDYGKVSTSRCPVEGVARVAYVEKEDKTCLVEFVASHPDLHDGNVLGDRIPKVRQHHGWWIGFEDIQPIIVESTIYRCGRDTYCVKADSNKVAGQASCSEGDQFDGLTGAIIALARAAGKDPSAAAMDVLKVLSTVPEEEKPETRLKIVNKFGEWYGTLGTLTKMKDSRGRPLHVGDEVLLMAEGAPGGKPITAKNWVVETKKDGPFIMGIHLACGRDGTIDRTWSVELASPYKDRLPGEDKDNYLFIRKIDDPAKSRADEKNWRKA